MTLQTLHRTMSADLLNRVANDAAVRPHIGGEGPIDLAGSLENAANVALVSEHGGFIFIRDEATRYELHTLLLPEGRGAEVLPAAAEAFRYVFTATDATEIITKVPEANKAAALMARRAGFVPLFTRKGAWADGSDVTYFALTLDAWTAQDVVLWTTGQDFHVMLDGAKAAAGSSQPVHADDEAHDRAVGAAVLMALAGNAGKAVWSYNRWARFAGYAPIQLMSVAPVTIDVRDAIVGVQGGRLEVLLCR